MDFRGDSEFIREQLARINRHRVEAHLWYAETLESKAVEVLEQGEYDPALRKYRGACNVCDAALQIAEEFPAGDAAEIRELRHRLDAESEAIRWKLASMESG